MTATPSACYGRPRVDGNDRSFRISSWLFARALGIVLAMAFLSLGVQAQGLFGERGIAPIASFVASAKAAGHHLGQHPSLFWFLSGDAMITLCWGAGLGAAALLAVGVVPKLALAVAWLTYLSFVSVGWPFMSFQWDILLLEVGVLAIFLTPLRILPRLRRDCGPTTVALWVSEPLPP